MRSGRLIQRFPPPETTQKLVPNPSATHSLSTQGHLRSQITIIANTALIPKNMKKIQSTLVENLASNVRSLRLTIGVSQEELADMCGLHRTYIGSVERGERNVTLSTLETLALALDIDAGKLLVNGAFDVQVRQTTTK